MTDFSIITPVFNGQGYVEETIKSVLDAAAGLDFEYLVIDDGSLDKTRDILKKYENQITYVYQTNSGQSSAINNGLSRARGKYASIVNADDPLLNSDIFLDSKKVLDADPEVVGTYPDWNIIDSHGLVIETVFVKDFSLDELIGRFNCLIGPGGIFRTTVAQKIGGWDASYKFVPDYDFWLRLLDYGKFQHIPKVQANWRTHENSISIGSRGEAMSVERIRVISEYLKRNPQTPKKLKKMAISHSYFRASVLSYFDKSIKARRLLWISAMNYPKILAQDLRVILYILFLPLSRQSIELIQKYSTNFDLHKRLQKKIKT